MLTSDFGPEVEMSHVCACALKNMQYTLIYDRSAEIPASYRKSGSRNTMVTRTRWHDDTMADTTFHWTYFWFEESKLKHFSMSEQPCKLQSFCCVIHTVEICSGGEHTDTSKPSCTVSVTVPAVLETQTAAYRSKCRIPFEEYHRTWHNIATSKSDDLIGTLILSMLLTGQVL